MATYFSKIMFGNMFLDLLFLSPVGPKLIGDFYKKTQAKLEDASALAVKGDVANAVGWGFALHGVVRGMCSTDLEDPSKYKLAIISYAMEMLFAIGLVRSGRADFKDVANLIVAPILIISWMLAKSQDYCPGFSLM